VRPSWGLSLVMKAHGSVGFVIGLAVLAGCTGGANPPVPTPPPAPSAATPVGTESPTPSNQAPSGVTALLRQAASVAAAPFEGEGWRLLLSGDSLNGWEEIDFAGRGEVRVESGLVVLGMGSPFTGLRYTNAFPTMNYEIALDAMRVMGSDFFCGLTVPVGDSHCSLIVGGWGGGLVGISSLDGYDASENETTKFMSFEKGRWYRVRLRVTPGRLEGWIDQEKLINVDTRDRRISVRPGEIERCMPLGIACWETGAAVRTVQWRPVSGPAGPLPGKRN